MRKRAMEPDHAPPSDGGGVSKNFGSEMLMPGVRLAARPIWSSWPSQSSAWLVGLQIANGAVSNANYTAPQPFGKCSCITSARLRSRMRALGYCSIVARTLTLYRRKVARSLPWSQILDGGAPGGRADKVTACSNRRD